MLSNIIKVMVIIILLPIASCSGTILLGTTAAVISAPFIADDIAEEMR